MSTVKVISEKDASGDYPVHTGRSAESIVRRVWAWEVLLELDDKATGHVCRVEVTLDRLESSLVES